MYIYVRNETLKKYNIKLLITRNSPRFIPLISQSCSLIPPYIYMHFIYIYSHALFAYTYHTHSFISFLLCLYGGKRMWRRWWWWWWWRVDDDDVHCAMAILWRWRGGAFQSVPPPRDSRKQSLACIYTYIYSRDFICRSQRVYGILMKVRIVRRRLITCMAIVDILSCLIFVHRA